MAKLKSRIEGRAALTNALDKKKRGHSKAWERAVVESGLYLLRETLKITPIDTGFLRKSGTVIKVGKGFDTKADVVFTAPYAVYVHENVGASFKDPGTQAKFLEHTARVRRLELKQIIRRSMKT